MPAPKSYNLPLTKETFRRLTTSKNRSKMTLAINAARAMGAFTCADVLALGRQNLDLSKLRRRTVAQEDIDLFHDAVASLVSREIPEDKMPQSEWSELYPDVLDASAANLLPARGAEYHFPDYQSLDFGQGSVTLGTFFQPNFEAIVVQGVQGCTFSTERAAFDHMSPLSAAIAHIDGLLNFRDQVVMPTVMQLDQRHGSLDANL